MVEEVEEPEWLQSKAAAGGDRDLGFKTYQRRKRKSPGDDVKLDGSDGGSGVLKPLAQCERRIAAPQPKRQRVQYFLDFGQSDFSYGACKVCGLVYARGQENDTKVHDDFHRSYLRGIQFQGWRHERIAARLEEKKARVIVVLPQDPVQHQTKVKEVASVMEREMGLSPNWLLHSQCKVYLYVESKRVLGCAVAEPIEQAFLATIENDQFKRDKAGAVRKEMVFGNVKLVREVHRKPKSTISDIESSVSYEKTPVPAVCGIRALWVIRSARRKGIASCLVDAVRNNFSFGMQMERKEIAFSQPTADGLAFAFRYTNTDLLVYT